jgi:carbonic anhydrase
MRRLLMAALLGLGMTTAARAGPMQSPIDIRPEHAVFSALPAFYFAYSPDAALSVLNTGSPDEEATVRANVSGGSSLEVAGVVYDLLQFHFHTEAEHLLDGFRYDMEMHLVHQALDGTRLVVGRFIELGAFNAALDPIFSALPPTELSLPLAVPDFDLNELLPLDLRSFRYDGSLTTFPYDEGVKWNVLLEPLQMSQQQIDAFRALFPDDNSRELHPINGRLVSTDVAGFAAVPEPATLALAGVGAIGLVGMIRRRRAS